MPSIRPFQPGLAPSTATIAMNQTSASVVVPTGTGQVLRVHNSSTVTAFVRYSNTTTTAVLTDTPIAAGGHELWGCPLDTGYYVHAITPTAAGTVIITRGEGGA